MFNDIALPFKNIVLGTKKYHISCTPQMEALLRQETPKRLENVETRVTGSVRQLCAAAETACRTLGYAPTVLTASLRCTARDAGSFLASIAQYHAGSERSPRIAHVPQLWW